MNDNKIRKNNRRAMATPLPKGLSEHNELMSNKTRKQRKTYWRRRNRMKAKRRSIEVIKGNDGKIKI